MIESSTRPADNFRKIKWEYIIPILATPTAHICVSLVRKYPQYKRKLWYAVGITTFLTVQTRLILMYDAGYPGAEREKSGKELPWYVKMLLL